MELLDLEMTAAASKSVRGVEGALDMAPGVREAVGWRPVGVTGVSTVVRGSNHRVSSGEVDP